MPLRRLVLAVLLLTPWARASSADEITIATFNCEFLLPAKVHLKYGLPFELYGEAARTWNEPGYRESHYRQAVAAVASYLATLDADVLVLAEVGNRRELEPLVEALAENGMPYDHVVVGDSTDLKTGQHVAVLSRRPLTPVLHGGRAIIPGWESYDEELDDANAERQTGVEKGLHVRFRAGDGMVNLIGLHLKSERGGHDADAQRIAQASIVRRYYLPLLERGEHVIVAGDLNDDRGQPALRRIRGRDDIGEDLLQTGQAWFFYDPPERRDLLAERWTYVYQGMRSQLDHILVSRSIADACTLVLPEFPAQDDELVSDHRPVVLRLVFRETDPEPVAGGEAGSVLWP